MNMESGERVLREREQQAPNFTDSFRNLQTIKAHPSTYPWISDEEYLIVAKPLGL